MNKKLVLATIFTATLLVMVNGMATSFSLPVKGEEKTYQLEISSLSVSNQSVSTTNGNAIEFSVSGYNNLTFNSNGYIANTAIIGGLKSISVVFANASSELKVSYGWSYNDYDVVNETIDSENPTYTFNDENPSFFRIQNKSGSSFSISSISLTYSCSETTIPDGRLYTFELHENEYWLTSSKSNIVVANIPSSYNGKPVTRICCWSFFGRQNLTAVIIPDSVTYIEYQTFPFCPKLTSVSIGKGVEVIEPGHVFIEDPISNLTIDPENPYFTCVDNIIYSKDMTEIIFFSPVHSGSFIIPNTVTTIRSVAFSECQELTAVTIPDSVATIGDAAFGYCHNLSSVSMGTGVTSIGVSAFTCTKITNINLSTSLETLGEGAFDYCDCLQSIIIPNRVETIEANTFRGCYSLTSVTLPSHLKEICEEAFYSCSLNSLVIPDGTKRIGAEAFSNNTSLSYVVMPTTIISVGEDAFPNMQKIYYKGDLTGWYGISGASNCWTFYYSEEYPYTTMETYDYRYWHYVDNQIVEWEF